MLRDVTLALVEGVDDWVLLAIGGGLFLLVLLAVVLALRARRGRGRPAGATTEDELSWGDAPAEPLPEPAVAGGVSIEEAAWPEPTDQPAAEPVAAAQGDVHHCRCPACQTQFTVNGAKPIVTNCPGCGKKGYLR